MKNSIDSIQSRREKIVSMLEESGSVSVTEMSRHFAVSESTIRRDFEAIDGEGVVRFHGGVRVNRQERLFEEKNALSTSSKEAIAAAAVGMIRAGQTVFLNAGSTTLALYRLIKDRDICIVTNNAAVLSEPHPAKAELILIGGLYREKSRSVVGGMARSCLEQVYADICFLGTNGVSLERGLTTIIHQEAEVNRVMGERADRLVCIADSSKLGVDAGFVSVPLERVTNLITDRAADEGILEQLRQKNVKVAQAN